MNYDIAIIGGGAAGLSAAIYASRGGMKTVVFESTGFGGQVNSTSDVDNYLGLPGLSGPALSEKMHSHAEKYNVDFKTEKVREIKNISPSLKRIVTRKETYNVKAVIIATGANPRKLDIQGEAELTGSGVSYCATCDGAFMKDKTVAVIGGGNTAFEDTLYLSKIAKKVYLINRSSKFRADKMLIDKASAIPNIQIVPETKPVKIQGDMSVKSLVVAHSISGKMSVADVDAVFIAVGRIPEVSLVENMLTLASDRSIITNEKMETSVQGIYAAGDVRNTPLRQIITAASDGAIAANSAIGYINSL